MMPAGRQAVLAAPCGNVTAMPDDAHRATVITSLNLKGGVGKTHACWLIAGVCQEQRRRCLVLDLDKQGNISTSLLPSADSNPGTDAFFNPAMDPVLGNLIRKTQLSHVDVIPGSFALEKYNITDPAQWASSGLMLSLVDPLREAATFYDYILIDCPADISIITYAALCASDFLLVPLEAAQWGALGTQHVTKTFEHVRSHYNANLDLLGFVVSRFKKQRKYQATYLKQLRQHFGETAFDTVIPDLATYEQAVTDRIPVNLHSPHSHASAVAREFFAELERRAEKLRSLRDERRSASVRQPVESLA